MRLEARGTLCERTFSNYGITGPLQEPDIPRATAVQRPLASINSGRREAASLRLLPSAQAYQARMWRVGWGKLAAVGMWSA